MTGRSRGAGRATAAACPCGSGRAYSACCRPFHLRSADPPTAEALMRSRYSAHAKHLDSYLAHSWHPTTRPADVHTDPRTTWTGLTVSVVTDGGPDDDTGRVEFTARYEEGGAPATLHEISEFVRLDGRWVYLRGGDQS